jgi:DNA gyrase subunit B
MRPLVEDGRLFLVDSPLFQASLPNSHTRFYAHTMEELKKKAGKLFNKCEVSRLKGHGEANSDAVAEYAMKPGTRKLIQIKVSDSSSGTLKAIMADDVTARKKLLGV